MAAERSRERGVVTPPFLVGGRRSAGERAIARAAGVDRFGRPTSRALGVSPRQLRKADPSLSKEQASRLSKRLTSQLRLKAGAGAQPPLGSQGSPVEITESRAAGPYPGAAGVDAVSSSGHAA